MECVEPIGEMHKILRWAIERYKVGLLTNIMPGQLRAMMVSGDLPNLTYDAIIDSSELGTIKPENQIYEIATERAGCPPEQILLIDDTRSNIKAAEKQGWKVLWFDDARLEEAVDQVREVLETAE